MGPRTSAPRVARTDAVEGVGLGGSPIGSSGILQGVGKVIYFRKNVRRGFFGEAGDAEGGSVLRDPSPGTSNFFSKLQRFLEIPL
jgi:hypothetical protein